MTWEVPIDDVVEWRRHLHQHPELSNKEYETSAFVEEKLRSFGLEPWRPTETSVVADIVGTKEGQGRTVAFRADMDALPVPEETGEPFASVNEGVMHACGHDTHTSMLLGTAKVLSGIRDQFSGRARLLFQHAEELNPGGAKFMVENGAMEGVDEVYGLHVMNGPKGTFGITRGRATSSAGGWFCTITGKGSHGSMPHKGIDPTLCAANIVTALNTIVARNIDPAKFCVVNPGMIQSGEAPNVIAQHARIALSIRTIDRESTEIAYRRAEQVVEGMCLAYNCTYEFEHLPPYDIVMNADAPVDLALAAIGKVVGEDKVSEVPPMSGSEDFSEFANVAPGCFIFLNGGDITDGLDYQNHHPKFNIVEDPTLENGVKAEVQILLDALA